MYNLKECGGTYKGIIGECLFKTTRRYLIVTKFFNKIKYFKIFGDKLTSFERDFLEDNWYSIDAIDFDYSKNPRKIVLFEIKTLNKYNHRKSYWKPKMTLTSHEIYNKALKIGFDVKFVIVWLSENWNFDIELCDFVDADYCVDKLKKYDKIKSII